MFVAKDQEFTDMHTGITIALGEHYMNGEVIQAGVPGSGSPGRLSWLRISVPADGDKPAKIATIQLSNGQIVRSDKHEAEPAGETSDADAARIEDEGLVSYDPPAEEENVAHKRKRRY